MPYQIIPNRYPQHSIIHKLLSSSRLQWRIRTVQGQICRPILSANFFQAPSAVIPRILNLGVRSFFRDSLNILVVGNKILQPRIWVSRTSTRVLRYSNFLDMRSTRNVLKGSLSFFQYLPTRAPIGFVYLSRYKQVAGKRVPVSTWIWHAKEAIANGPHIRQCHSVNT